MQCQYTKENFERLLQRINQGFQSVDSNQVDNFLKEIIGPCLVTGTGGSYAAAYFASLALEERGILTKVIEPRDIFYQKLINFNSLLAVTYGNSNYGVSSALEVATAKNLSTFIVTSSNDFSNAGLELVYNQEPEHSFISIAATLTPMAVLMANNLKINAAFERIFNNVYEHEIDPSVNTYEIMTGDNTYTAAKILDSNLVEAGIAVPVIHDKYSYCHGRSTLSYRAGHSLIYLQNGRPTELDIVLKQAVAPYYEQIIVLSTNEETVLLGEYDLAVQAMYLSQDIARAKRKSLSCVDYSPVVKKLYRFRGEL